MKKKQCKSSPWTSLRARARSQANPWTGFEPGDPLTEDQLTRKCADYLAKLISICIYQIIAE